MLSTAGATTGSVAGAGVVLAPDSVGAGRAGACTLGLRAGAGLATALAAGERVVRFTVVVVVAVAGSLAVVAVSSAGVASGAGVASIVGGGGVSCGIGSVTGCASWASSGVEESARAAAIAGRAQDRA